MQSDLVETFGSYTSWKLNENTWIINFMGGSQNIYLLEGADRALLIDTGWGTGTLRAYVERLTQKPVIAALTHGHLDHSGGCGEWESVLMLPGAETDLYSCSHLPFDISRLPHPDFRRELVKDRDVIDLGGREVELLDISAHSNGSLAFLDHGGGLLLVGDELESSQVLMYKVEEIPGTDFVLDQRLLAHHANMIRLRERRGEWNAILPAHNGAPIAHSYLDDFIALTEHIYAGDAAVEDKLNHLYAEASDPEHKLCRVRWGGASFFLVKEDMLALYGGKTL